MYFVTITDSFVHRINHHNSILLRRWTHIGPCGRINPSNWEDGTQVTRNYHRNNLTNMLMIYADNTTKIVAISVVGGVIFIAFIIVFQLVG